MGFFDWLTGRKALSTEIVERNRQWLMQAYGFNLSNNIPVSQPENALTYINEGYQANVDIFSVVNWVDEQAANVPIRVQQMKGDQWEFVPEHDLQKLIDRPNPYQSGIEQRMQLFGYYNITGNGLLYGPRLEEGRNKGQTQEMWVMPSQNTQIISGGWMNPIKGYALSQRIGHRDVFRFKDVLHMRTPNLSFGTGQEFWGMSPIRAGLLALNRSNQNYIAATTAYKNQGAAGIIHEKNPTDYTDDLESDKTDDWIERFNGPTNKGKVKFSNKELGWLKLGLSPVDLQMIQDKRATLRDFCNMYKVSSIIFNDNENSSFNNVSEAKKSAYNDAVLPLVNRYVREMMDWIVKSYGDDIRIIADISDISVLQSDKKEQAERIKILRDSTVMTPNEGRITMGLEPLDIPEMDIPTTTFSVIPITDISDGGLPPEDVSKSKFKHYLDKK